MIYYKDTQLAKGSRAYDLYLQWQKTKKPEDKKLLDLHLKEVETRGRELLLRYK